MMRLHLVFLASVFFALAALAQEAPAPAAPAEQEETFEQNLEELLQEPFTAESYRYDAQGRRDPFRSLIGPRQNPRMADRPPGSPGFLVEEIDLTGVVRTKQGLVAMIGGPDNQGYLLRVGDKVFDGEVVRITSTSIVFRQEVNDPTQIERYREVVKELAADEKK